MVSSQVSFTVCLLMALSPAVSALTQTEGVSANPVRRVVSLLQSMQAKVTAEQVSETELYEKYMCYCKASGGNLQADIAGSTAKIPQVESAIKEAEETKVQLQQDIKEAQTSRSEAKDAMARASAIREKEAKAYAAETADLTANIEAMSKAIAALEKGAAGGFLQTNAAHLLQKLTVDMTMNDYDRRMVTSFLSGGEGEVDGYAPQSGEVIGILKDMKDQMSKSFEEATAAEKTAKEAFEGLIAAKKKEIEACTAAIEEKTVRVGELGVEVAQMKNDLDDTAKALLDDKAFLADLDKNCDEKETEFAEIKKTRAEELVAIAETIKILNDDDALDLFKKTLPSPSLVQITARSQSVSQRALGFVRQARNAGRSNRQQLDLIALALTGRKVNFDAVFKLIDNLVDTLAKEQLDDEAKKENCEKEFDLTDDKKKALSRAISDLETSIDESSEKIGTTADEMKELEAGIKALDKEVAEQTSTRKEENEDYTKLMASDRAAKELLGYAKNRLNKFYNPALYKPPPKRELSEEERLYSNFGGELPTEPAPALIQIKEHRAADIVAPPPPPESFKAYAKKGEESAGVIQMLDMLVADLDKEMVEAETSEKNAQKEYDTFMSDAAEARASKTRALTDKNAAKASLEGDLQQAKDSKASKVNELMATEEYDAGLHSECDWLLSNFDLRKTARAAEVDSLKSAKAVLAGADYSF